MSMIRCGKGLHYYDNAKYGTCPYCGIFSECDDDTVTVALNVGNVQKKSEKQKKLNSMADMYKDDDEVKTIAKYSKNEGNDFVVGWLVCIAGIHKGRDYRLFHGRNFMGRDYGMDICVEGDMQISRKKHCAVIYEERKNKFYIMPVENTVYVNDCMVNGAIELENGQEIVVGESKFVFVAFCGGERKWEK